jgi:hypothetical protein
MQLTHKSKSKENYILQLAIFKKATKTKKSPSVRGAYKLKDYILSIILLNE